MEAALPRQSGLNDLGRELTDETQATHWHGGKIGLGSLGLQNSGVLSGASSEISLLRDPTKLYPF